MSLVSLIAGFMVGSVLLVGPVVGSLEETELEWGTWGDCSRSCGGGTQVRRKVCGQGIDFATCRIRQSLLARRELREIKECNTDTCPETGTWGAWSDWQPCSSTCGTSRYQIRTRPCQSDSINYPTGHCDGVGFEWRPCDDLPPCPNPIVSDPTDYSFPEPSDSSTFSSSSGEDPSVSSVSSDSYS